MLGIKSVIVRRGLVTPVQDCCAILLFVRLHLLTDEVSLLNFIFSAYTCFI
jgi:hypothetical protein